MQSINITTYSDPSGYKLSSLPKPEVSDPSDVVIQVYAASINPIDVKKAAGAMKMLFKDPFPYKIGYDCAGIVLAVGGTVTRVKPGDEVYTRLPESHRGINHHPAQDGSPDLRSQISDLRPQTSVRATAVLILADVGSWSQFAKCPESDVALKPASLSFEAAASLPLAAMTALQALQKYNGSLAGKTVFVPAGLSGTGSYACQLAKNVFGAGKVITTVSTSKVPKVPELLGEGVVDEIIDYTQTNAATSIPPKSVDFMFDTTGQAMEFLSRMVPKTGLVISVSTTPSGKQMQNAKVMKSPGAGNIPWVASALLNMMDSVRKWRAKRWGVGYEYMFLESKGTDLDALRGHVDAGRLKPVVGLSVKFEDIEGVKKAAMTSYQGKGAIGKTVIRMDVK
ncbi:Alcohol dehydrogenase superfamily, zinc-type [Metarhizium rileyi]|uniref:Alcohol dehydrogenase superfamily, zinc-type n=1 Tax=Metarhizium rileyi (strain RCEF 4871) TaxID=1649241 RepID=A0A167FB12_METRR|nr:Alcohol dehydrogenase superfamily, zinc-type [Metarhizium rileyi RCEF 4871]